ncbi:MAG TPA: ABA4-like family protein [Flavitalea sp.]|nr:ABA4-like family protein [Flavitalea sp.]
MTPELVFSICNMVAMVGWIILIVLPWWISSDRFIIGVIISLLAIVYTWMIVSSFHLSDLSAFGSLDGVMRLFTDRFVVTAGWIHYLAFDLMVGLFIRKNAVRHDIHHALVIPCLLVTFIFGPAGLVLYFIIRIFHTRQYFTTNF